jgi:ATP-binding cassette subfamily B protein
MSVFFIRLLVQGITQGRSYSYLLGLLAVASFLIVLRRTIYAIFNHYVKIQSDQLVYQYINRIIYLKATDVELAAFENSSFYDLYTKAALEVSTRPVAVLDNCVDFLFTLAAAITMTLSLVKLDPFALLFLLFPLVIAPLLGGLQSKRKYDLDMANIKHNRMKTYVNRIIYASSYASELRTTNIFSALSKNYREASSNIIDNQKKYGSELAFIKFFLELCNLVIPFFASSIYAIFRITVSGSMDISIYSILSVVVVSLAGNIKGTTNAISQMYLDGMYAGNLKSFFSYTPKISESQEGLKINSFHELRFEQVSFSYESQTIPTLNGINWSIKRGEKIAIVGYNGAGKSTLIKLLLRLYDPNQGSVSMNGVDIKEYNLQSYRHLFGSVMQDFQLFALSVKDNILFGNSEDVDRAKNAATISGISDKIDGMPKGYDTILTREFDDAGELLSVGELQRLAIARMLASDFQIAVLDEPSSSLDPIAEHAIIENMMKAVGDKTVVMISHRLSSAALMDRIYFLENGNIVESGSHEQLLKQSGKYARMFLLQAAAYQTDFRGKEENKT